MQGCAAIWLPGRKNPAVLMTYFCCSALSTLGAWWSCGAVRSDCAFPVPRALRCCCRCRTTSRWYTAELPSADATVAALSTTPEAVGWRRVLVRLHAHFPPPQLQGPTPVPESQPFLPNAGQQPLYHLHNDGDDGRVQDIDGLTTTRVHEHALCSDSQF